MIERNFDAGGFELGHGFDELLHRARQAVEFPDHKRIAFAHVIERLGEFGAVLFGAARRFLENPLAARLREAHRAARRGLGQPSKRGRSR